jgi:hypothetical protein
MSEDDEMAKQVANVVVGLTQLRLLIQDFRVSMSQGMDDLENQLAGVAREVRAYNQATTITISNELAALDSRWERRFRQVEDRLADVERRRA